MSADIHILYEDDNILAVNKPAGLLVHGNGKDSSETVADWLVEKYPEVVDIRDEFEHEAWAGASRPPTPGNRPGIVHRLDRDTTGVLVVAKTQAGFDHLKQQFQSRSVHKVYHAFVYGRLKNNHDTINVSIGRSRSDFRRWSAQPGKKGKLREAVTEYNVIKEMGEYSFVELLPKTGRTHQLRVHMKYIHHPIVADRTYAGKLVSQNSNLGFERQALHARSVEFEDMAGKRVRVEAEYPEDFRLAISR